MATFLSESEAKKQVIAAGKQLVDSGLIARTWGNVSCRISESHFVITPSGRDYLSLTESDIVKVAMDDLSYEGHIKPSGEKAVHAEIYLKKPTAMFVIHTHQEKASIVGTLDLQSMPVLTHKSYFGDQVICAQYGLPGTKKLRKAIGTAIESSTGQAVIMKSHGAVCFGKDNQEAFFVAKELEHLCQQFLEKTTRFLTPTDQEANRMGELIEKISQKKESDLMEADEPEINDRMLKEMENHIQSAYEACQVWVLNQGIFHDYSLLNQPLYPLLDDFAQIVGTKVKCLEKFDYADITRALNKASAVIVRGFGFICRGDNQGDLQAVEMILHKNIESQLYGEVLHSQSKINWLDRQLMRWVYLKKYSKQL